MNKYCFLLFIALLHFNWSAAQKPGAVKPDTIKPEMLGGLAFRNIGPAVASGRIIDLAVNPQNKSEYYVAIAAGGVFKTTNAGNTYQPIFDNYGSYSIGCVTLDPNNPYTVWVGSGENNNQRSVGYGDGVYRSDDGGRSFTNMGLKNSEHIGMIKVDPRNSNVVYVAAYGPLWKEGGDRGVYKSTDGGKTWKNILSVSEHTGCNEIHMDPRNPDVLYAAFHQRRRHEWTYLGGGPESALYKSTDGGATWKKLGGGLPTGDVGRITLSISPVNPDVIYSMVEAATGAGLYRSTNRGESWEKRSDRVTAGNYYQEIYADPVNVNRIYIMDTWLQWSNDGGKTVSNVGERNKHVDNHAIWIDPADNRHWLVGCDGGLYETWDEGQNWQFKPNLPVTQFYRVSVDNSKPFYYVYGGTQDNNTLGGPSSSLSISGVTNNDWFVTVGGDGFKSQIDPKDPNTVYSQWQYGGLIRFDRRTGEQVDIKPVEAKGEPALRWNWDAPLLISRHDNKTLYFAANKIYRSTDRGNSWELISPDLTRQTDRNKLPVMGKVWSMDAVAKNQSTSIFGNITFLSESPLDPNMLYAGTDDGLVWVTNDLGRNWEKCAAPAGVPDMTLVTCLFASRHSKDVVYATFDNHRRGDFKPYVYRSADRGKTWTSVSSNLPAGGSVKTIAEDHVKSDLIFLGTEFGAFFTPNGGATWTQLKNGLPTIAVKDIAIQEEENDLVLATFGRGFAILDNYAPLREISSELLKKEAHIFPVKKAMMFIPSRPLGSRTKGHQGEMFYTAPNRPYGAVIRYYLKDDYKSLKGERKDREKALIAAGKPVYYPSADSIRLEDFQEEPYLMFIISDSEGKEVRRLKAPATKGIGKVVWDLRLPSTNPATLPTPDLSNPYAEADDGPLAVPGTYGVKMFLVKNGVSKELAGTQSFECAPLFQEVLGETDRKAVLAYAAEAAELRRRVAAAAEYSGELRNQLNVMKKAAQTASAPLDVFSTITAMQWKLSQLSIAMNGDGSLAGREFETVPGIYGRVENAIGNVISSTSAPTGTMKKNLEIAAGDFATWLDSLQSLDADMEKLMKRFDELNMPYTPGRKPFFNR